MIFPKITPLAAAGILNANGVLHFEQDGMLYMLDGPMDSDADDWGPCAENMVTGESFVCSGDIGDSVDSDTFWICTIPARDA